MENNATASAQPAPTGSSAVAGAAVGAGDGDLVITDVVMPETNGRKLADEATRRWPHLKVLFTTGYSRNAIIHNGVLDAGVNLIGKPFTLQELAARGMPVSFAAALGSGCGTGIDMSQRTRINRVAPCLPRRRQTPPYGLAWIGPDG